jgi:glycerol-3-phosphate dehydrogenase
MRPAKGVHITVPWDHLVRNDVAAVIPGPQGPPLGVRRAVGEFTYIGTTDTDYDGRSTIRSAREDDIDYLLSAPSTVQQRQHDHP